MSAQVQIVLIAAGCTGAVGLAGMGIIRLPRRRSLRLSIHATNLLANAIRHTPPGGRVHVEARRTGTPCSRSSTAAAASRKLTSRTSSTWPGAAPARAAPRPTAGPASAWRSCAASRKLTGAACES
jgi:hypothetical protein